MTAPNGASRVGVVGMSNRSPPPGIVVSRTRPLPVFTGSLAATGGAAMVLATPVGASGGADAGAASVGAGGESVGAPEETAVPDGVVTVGEAAGLAELEPQATMNASTTSIRM